jgi:DNA-binding response OmpR family regulator
MSKQIKILLVEDDPNLGTLLSEYLIAKNYDCTLATDGQKGYDLFVKEDYDFLILDVMMPIKDGFTLAEEIRGIDKKVPMLFLTAKSLKEDTLKGFAVGADDYMTKPFSMEELLVRIQAILRRVGGEEEDLTQFQVGKYIFNSEERQLKLGEEQQKLTTKENELLKLLCKNVNGVLERNNALKAVWGDDNYFNGRSMDVYIAKLRKYLKQDENVEIVNVHGKGFKLFVRQ